MAGVNEKGTFFGSEGLRDYCFLGTGGGLRGGGEKSDFHFPVSFEIVWRPLGSPGTTVALSCSCPRERQVAAIKHCLWSEGNFPRRPARSLEFSGPWPAPNTKLDTPLHSLRAYGLGDWVVWGLCCPLLCPKTKDYCMLTILSHFLKWQLVHICILPSVTNKCHFSKVLLLEWSFLISEVGKGSHPG